MKHKHIFAFEEFDPLAMASDVNPQAQLENPYDTKELIEKLRLYAQASDVPTKVSEISSRNGVFSFDIFTNIPSEDRNFGHKMFRVEVTEVDASNSRVVTYEGDMHQGYRKTLDTSIEVEGENNLHVILWNYIEATQLFDDNVTEDIVDSCKKIHTVEDIHNITKTLITQKNI